MPQLRNDEDDPQRSRQSPRRSISLADLGASSEASEFYSPIPAGYQKGRHKYIVVVGTVMSGLGKGIFASSLAKLMKDKGLSVAPIKMEGYLNIDAGTLNPFRHGEVFVLDDGTECDMDLGTYERMLDQNLSRQNFVTSGQIYSDILTREREGGYLGRDVQMIPHVTGEVKLRLRELAMQGDGDRPADVVFVEVGGTVGDHENAFYIEALRELAFEEGPDSTCFVALTYVIEPPALGEQKSKAAQLGVKRLLEAGVQPHIIACRSSKPASTAIMQKIALFSNVPITRVFSMHDRPSIYTIPEALREGGLDREVLSILGLHNRVDTAHEDRSRTGWVGFVSKLTSTKPRSVEVGLLGKYTSLRDSYASIDKAGEHCGAHLGCDVVLRWVDTSEITPANVESRLEGLDAVVVPGGFGRRGVEGKIASVRMCREKGVPFLGICLGFQVAVIEFARNLLGLPDADSTEFSPDCRDPVISELPEQKAIEQLGGSMRLGGQDVLLTPGSLVAQLYAGAASVRQRFRHRYEVDPAYVDRLEEAGMRFTGRHPNQPIMQALELDADTHPYFVAAQYHPELTGRPLRPQPLFMGLIASALLHQRPGAELPEPWRSILTPRRGNSVAGKGVASVG